MSSWQPIETAPKKGEFMVWIADTDLPWPGYAGGDRVYSNAHGLLNEMQDGRVLRATHWMPMPEGPSMETSAATPYEDCTCIWDLNRKYILKIDPSCRYMGVSHHAENTVAERSWPMCRKCEQRHLVGSECGSQF